MATSETHHLSTPYYGTTYYVALLTMALLTVAGTVTDSATKTAKAVDPTRGRRMTITGTHGYRAPEVYERDYGKGADWCTSSAAIPNPDPNPNSNPDPNEVGQQRR